MKIALNNISLSERGVVSTKTNKNKYKNCPPKWGGGVEGTTNHFAPDNFGVRGSNPLTTVPKSALCSINREMKEWSGSYFNLFKRITKALQWDV